jgi:RNA polymerase sigma factor (sigma-70 family)
MRDRDAEDHALLEAANHAELLAAYYPVILERLRLRLPREDVYEVGHAVIDRLLRELTSGRSYSVPFRVVVHMVVKWKLAEHFGRASHAELVEEPEATDDPRARMEERIALQQILRELPDREREVLEMRYLDGCEIIDIAARLGITRNAVDQALFRGRQRLRELLHA